MIPKLRGQGTPSDVVDWIKRFIAWTELGDGATGDVPVATPVGVFRPGFMQIIAGATPPEGWIVADNSLVFINAAEDLYAAVGLDFDPAPPANMFRLPGEPIELADGFTWIIKL